MAPQKWKAQCWRGSIDGEVGEWVDVPGAIFDSELDARQWELDNQEEYARSGTTIIPCESATGERL